MILGLAALQTAQFGHCARGLDQLLPSLGWPRPLAQRGVQEGQPWEQQAQAHPSNLLQPWVFLYFFHIIIHVFPFS